VSAPVLSGPELAALLDRHRFDFYTGVPCSLVEDLIVALEGDRPAPWIPAVREDVAVGLAAGAWLGGRRPAVIMQNSGLGTSLNALASLSLMYGFPALLIVTWRGFGGRDAPEHILTGEITPGLLDLLRIPHRTLDAAHADELLGWAAREMDAGRSPVALLVPPGVVATGAEHRSAASGAASRASSTETAPSHLGRDAATAGRETLTPVLSRAEAIAVAVKELGDEPVIHANGYICRESWAIDDRPQNFYMIGSMGMASAIGLGLALARPASACIVFDGDGNLLMSLGTLAMVGSLGPRNFVHLVYDNEVYGSTGGQRSPSREVRLDRLARGAGYRTATAVTTAAEIARAVRAARAAEGPHFILAKVTAAEAPAPRIPHSPEVIRDRFRRALGGR
jgi:phosphonopyruvate decarboxylase